MTDGQKIGLFFGVLIVGGFGALFYFVLYPAFEAFDSGNPSQSAETKAAGDPGAVDEELIDHLQAGRYREAYELMASGYRDTVPFEDFRRVASQNAYLQSRRSIGCYRVVTRAKKVQVRECIIDADAGTASATLHYTLEDKRWRMTGITIGGLPALPAAAAPAE